MEGFEKYNPDKGTVLSTYAWNPIRWEIIKEIKSVKKGKGTSLNIVSPPWYKPKDELWEVLPTTILSDEEIDFLQLRKMGYKLAEMADISGRTNSYVKRIFYKAIRKIRENNA